MSEQCFVLMPFGDPFDEYYKVILAPAIKAAGFHPVRADEIYGTRPIIEDIFDNIRKSAALVADVTSKNPNVNYELGIAHSLNRPVIIISQSMQDVPFDYQHRRIIIYNTRRVNWVSELSDAVTKTLQALEESQALQPQHSLVYFSKWNDAFFRQRIQTAKEICMQAFAPYGIIDESVDGLEVFVKRGGMLRCILVDPNGVAVQMVAKRNVGAASDIKYLANLINITIQKLKDIAAYSADKEQVQVRMIDYLPEPVLTIIDPDAQDGVELITLNGFQKPIPSRPSFNLYKRQDETSFRFFHESFEALWNSVDCQRVDL